MNFLELALQGVEKSKKAEAVLQEVNDVFHDVNSDLGNFPGYKVELTRSCSLVGNISRFNSFFQKDESDYFDEDILRLSVSLDQVKASDMVSGWRQNRQGFPCVLIFGGQEVICQDRTQLVSGLSELLSSVGFGNVLNALIKKVDGDHLVKK